MKNIVLIGFATAYKTTVGKLLAQHLNYSWYDTDLLIKEHCGINAGELLNNQGELALRQLEYQAICTLPTTNCVVSCGGGVPLFDMSINKLSKNAIIVWLKVNAVTVKERLAQDKTFRPLHQSLTTKELTDFIAKRDVIYAQYATHCVVTDNKTPDEVVKEILAIIEQ